MLGWRDHVGTLYAQHRSRLVRLAVRQSSDLEQAADLVQDAFVRLLAAGGSGSLESDTRRLYVVARNVSLDHRKSVTRRRDAVLVSSQIAREVPSPQQSVEAASLLRAVESAMRRMPARTQAVFVLRRVEGLSHARIAERLGMSQSTVEKHLLRAMRFCEAAVDNRPPTRGN